MSDSLASPAVRRSLRAPGARAAMLLAFGCLAALGFTPLAAEQAASGSGFHVAGTHVIGGEASWDYAEYDAIWHRLFVARAGGVLVIDAETMKPIES